MRFERLDIVRWGALEDVSLDFSGESRLELVFGENEAGKSTLRRAISAALFGIPPQSPDRGRHGYSSLRLGATVRRGAGDALRFFRRKGSKNTLLDAQDAPMSEALLGEFLGGVDRETFEREWSLDHARLRAGGEALLRGEGELGQSLLTAGLGGASVAELQKQLESEARELFYGNRPSRVVRLLEQIREARRARDAHAVHVRRAEERQGALASLRSRRAELEQDRDRLAEEARHLDVLARLLPLLDERSRATTALAALGERPELAPDFGRRLAAAEPSRRSARDALDTARLEVRALERELASLVVDEGVLGARSAIEELSEVERELAAWHERARLASSAIAVADRAIDAIAERAATPRALLQRLAQGDHRALYRRAWDLAAKLAEQGARARAVGEEVQNEERALAELEGRLHEVAMTVPPELAAAVGDAKRELAAVEERLREAKVSWATRAKAVGDAFEALPHWPRGPLGRRALETAVLPTVSELAEAARALDAERRAVAARQSEVVAAEDLARIEGELRAARAPTEEGERALGRARRERDGLWAELRAALESGDATAATAVADRYEARVRAVDSLGDELRRVALRAADAASGTHAEREASVRLERAKLDRLEAEEEAARARAAWNAMWRALSLEPGTPEAMRAWLDEARRIRALFDEERAAEAERRALEERAAAAVAPLARLLGRAEADDAEGRLRLVDEASRRLDVQAQQQDLALAAAAAASRLAVARAQALELQARREAGESERRALLADLGAEGDSTVDAAIRQLEAASEVALLVPRREEEVALLREAEAREASARGVATKLLASIGCRADDDLATAPRALAARLLRAREAEAARQTITARLEDARKREDAALRAAEAADLLLAELCVEAGIDDESALAKAEADSEAKRSRRLELARLDREIGALAPPGFEAPTVSLASVNARRGTLDEARRALDERIRDLSQEIGGAEHELGSIVGGSAAADDDAVLEGLVASLGEVAQQYLRVSYAAWLLARGAEGYRQRNQNTMLARAGDLFRRVTRESFSGIVVDDEGGGRGVIKGVRHSGLLGVEAMSEGTRDQLFLALRLAAVEAAEGRREPLPFVLDDVLINLDDARVAATLDVLAQMASRAQVIVFTHHARIAEIAAARQADVVRVHRLVGAAAAS